MKTASLNIPIEIPNSTTLNLEELKHQLTEYARLLVKKSADDSNKIGVRTFEELHPQVQALCGVVSLTEDDLDGEMARLEYLREL